MKLSKMIASKLRAAARYIEKPEMLAVRRRGVDMGIYEKLDRPWFAQQKISTVLDIGANAGQFAFAIHAACPEARIYSFEPLPDCFKRLQERMTGVKNFEA